MQRLAALVPRPRLHLIRFHGVLAPNSKLRAAVVPTPSDPLTSGSSSNTDSNADTAHGLSRSSRISWARLLGGVFALDLERCSHCAGKLSIIAAIVEAKAINRILSHLGLPTRAPPRLAPRAALNAA